MPTPTFRPNGTGRKSPSHVSEGFGRFAPDGSVRVDTAARLWDGAGTSYARGMHARADTAVTFGAIESSHRYEPAQPGWDPPRSDRRSSGAYQFDLGLQLGLARRGEWRGRAVGLVTGVQSDVLTRGLLDEEFGASGLVNVGPFARCELGF